MHVIMHAQMAEEAGHFDLEAIAAEANAKMIRRHPHVFGDTDLSDSAAVVKQWDAIKAAEKKRGVVRKGVFKHLPPQLNALLYSRDVYKQIDKQALGLPDSISAEKIDNAAQDLDESSAGQQLFELVAACHKAGIDPESALRRCTHKVIDQIELKSGS